MINKKNFWIYIFPLALLFSIIIYLTLIYIQPSVLFSAPPESQWWSALSILVALFFAILAINYFKSSEINDLKDSINTNESQIKDVLNIISVVSNIQTSMEEKNVEDWEQLISRIKLIENKNLINSKDLRSWSTIAWRQGFLHITKELRETAYTLNKNEIKNRSSLISVLASTDGVEKQIIELSKGIKADTPEDYSLAQASIGKYYMRVDNYKTALIHFENCLDFQVAGWHYVGFIIVKICLNEIDQEFKNNILQWYSDQDFIWNKKNIKACQIFGGMVISIITTESPDIFYSNFSYLNSVKYLKDFNSYTKHELFSVYKNLVKTNLSPEQLDRYLTYYYFLGTGDKEAEIELSKPDVLKRITDRIKSF